MLKVTREIINEFRLIWMGGQPNAYFGLWGRGRESAKILLLTDGGGSKVNFKDPEAS